MTFDSNERSTEDGNPIWLYDIFVGQESFHLTGTNENSLEYVTLETHVYTPAVIEATQPRVDQDQAGSEVQLAMPTSLPAVRSLTTRWATAAPEVNQTSVRIYKVHRDDGEVRPFWFGRISSFEYIDEGRETIILCRSLGDFFTQQGPRRNWGRLCQNQLFDRRCMLDIQSFIVLATVTAVSSDGRTYTLDGVPDPVVRYQSGELRKFNAADSRLVVDRSGNDITVQYPVPSIGVGDNVELIPGCDRSLLDCANYNNDINFGGTPYTPDRNPFTKGLAKFTDECDVPDTIIVPVGFGFKARIPNPFKPEHCP